MCWKETHRRSTLMLVRSLRDWLGGVFRGIVVKAWWNILPIIMTSIMLRTCVLKSCQLQYVYLEMPISLKLLFSLLNQH
jgi:hypothetical protein